MQFTETNMSYLGPEEDVCSLCLMILYIMRLTQNNSSSSDSARIYDL